MSEADRTMSDGENAGPGPWGQRGSSAPDGGTTDHHPHEPDQWLTRSPRPAAGSAPWERGASARERHGAASDRAGGNHADGVPVADLIAKLNADRLRPRGRHRSADPVAPPAAEPPFEEYPEPDPADADATGAERTVTLAALDDPWPADDAEPAAFDDTPEDHTPGAAFDDAPDTEVIPAAADSAPADDLPDLAAIHQRRRATPAHVGRRSAPRPEKSAGRKRRRAIMAGRAVAALFAVLALATTGGAWQWQSVKNNMFNRVSALDRDSRDIIDPNAQFGDENFLIVGVDSRYGENADIGAGTVEDAAGARSDTVILVNIPASRERVVAVSFPRDLYIDPIKCEPWNPVTGEYGPITDPESPMYGMDEVYTEYKLNSAYAVGGPKCLVKVIQKLSGLAITRFMAVDFAGFQKMVDALGGVEVCTTEPLEDYELGTILPTAGRQIVDGRTALNYVRARQVVTEGNGDYGRIKRQQLFLSSLLRSLISKEVFFSLSKLNNVVNLFIEDSYVDNMDTKDLVTLGQSIQGISAGRITFLTVPTTGYSDEWGNEHLREEDTRAIFDAIINDLPLPEEKTDDNTPVPGTPESNVPPPTQDAQPAPELVNTVTTYPQDITVQVSNSTDRAGLGAATAQQLEAYGFNVTTPDDYPGPLDKTTVFFSPGNEEAAATVASAFNTPVIEKVSGLGDVVRVVLGDDFQAVGAPFVSGSPVQVHVVRGTMRTSTTTQLPDDLTITNAADATCG
jgi:LCP family protein required for cell wall assembly